MITKATFYFGTPRNKYWVGDTRMRGKTEYIKQIRYSRDPLLPRSDVGCVLAIPQR